MQNWDTIIVGGGMIGLATAYYLSKMGQRVLLLEAGDLGGGTSGACAGRAQVNEGSLDPLNLQLIRDGLARMDHMEEELGTPFEWHRYGYICLIRQESSLENWKPRLEPLNQYGITTEIIDSKAVKEAEPLMFTDNLIGAAYSKEGVVNPFKYCWAWAKAARRHGAQVRPLSPVTGMEISGHKVVSVLAGGERYSAGNVAVMSGAWTPALTRLAGVEVPLRHTHAEAFITEKLPPLLNNTIGIADFYETIHGKEKAVAIGVGPHLNGTLMVTESVSMTEEFHRRNSMWGISGMAEELLQLFPSLGKVKILRSWGAPTSFTPDSQPLVGWVPELDNLFVTTSFEQTITVVPLVCEWIAMMLVGAQPPVSLEMFSPARFSHK